MKAKKIYETLGFEQGGDPYKKLKIGDVYRELKIGDKFIFNTNIYYDYDIDRYTLVNPEPPKTPIVEVGEKCEYEELNSDKTLSLKFTDGGHIDICENEFREFLAGDIITRIKK